MSMFHVLAPPGWEARVSWAPADEAGAVPRPPGDGWHLVGSQVAASAALRNRVCHFFLWARPAPPAGFDLHRRLDRALAVCRRLGARLRAQRAELATARATERERCAGVCDERAAWYWDEYNRTHRTVSEHYSDAAEECATFIRDLRDHDAAPSAEVKT